MAGSDDREPDLRRALLRGLVIPAHPLALTEARRLDERRQTALTRYYCDAGAGGIAVGVHTTQFAIRDPGIQLLRPVLELARDTVRRQVMIDLAEKEFHIDIRKNSPPEQSTISEKKNKKQ